MSKMIKIVACAAVAMGIGFAGATSAQAGGYGHGYHHAPHCHYEWVTTWHFKTIKEIIYVTEYDHCGKPYQVEKCIFKTIKVPVKKYVKVCH